MKKITVALFASLMLFSAAFAQEADANNEDSASSETGTIQFIEINNLINMNLIENAPMISQKSPVLSQKAREMLYRQNKKEAGFATGYNILGFGIGSYLQGDYEGAKIIMTGDLFCLGGILLGSAIYGLAYNSIAEGWAPSIEFVAIGEVAGLSVILGSAAVSAGYLVYALIRPSKFAKDYNRTLQDALWLPDQAVSFQPVIDPVDGKYGLVVSLKL